MPTNNKSSKDDMKEYRIESLKRLIPVLIERKEKKEGQRLLLVFVALFVIAAAILFAIKIETHFLITLFLALIISAALMILSYIISSLSFFITLHENMIIEKLKTELYTLTDDGCEAGDMLLEIDKIRNPII